MKIQESAENYLETILVLSLDKPYVRSIDIANELGFSKPSVSVAMKNLRNSGHIRVDENGHITLAPTGKKIAEMIYERHRILSQWLESLGVSRETASEDACRIDIEEIEPLRQEGKGRPTRQYRFLKEQFIDAFF